MSFSGGGGADTNFTEKDAIKSIPGFIAGGLHARTTIGDGGNPKVFIEDTGKRRERINELSGKYGDLRDEFSGLRERVAPGFSEIRKARLGAVENARKRAQSTLSGNFARRRLMGSSFASDALARSELEAGQIEAEERAKTFLEEMAATVDLINKEGAADIAETEVLINDMNFQAQIAAGMAKGAQSAISNIMNTSKQLAAQEMSEGDFWTGIGGSVLMATAGTALGAVTGGVGTAAMAGLAGAASVANQASKAGQVS